MLVAVSVVIYRLPDDVSLRGAVRLAGALQRMNIISFDWDLRSRYNFWSGLAGGFFLALSYFGTDQSQVQRYLSGRSLTESRLGLLFNGAVKVPMQFVILFIGVMVFVFYIFTQPPLFFNAPVLQAATARDPALMQAYEQRHTEVFEAQQAAAHVFLTIDREGGDTEGARAELLQAAEQTALVRQQFKWFVSTHVPGAKTQDSDYIFLTFVMQHMPQGLVGLLIAVIFCAAMSSTASELTALGSTTMVDLYKKLGRAHTPARELLLSKAFTATWGLVGIAFASFAGWADNLIEAVNILGSLFYGTVLGLFAVAFFVKRVTATPVLIAALMGQVAVLLLFFSSTLGFLWYNVIGCALVVGLSTLLQQTGWFAQNAAPAA